ncbi:MAG TPA: hypothetical protein ENI07_19930 [Desulfobacterales bacterium]|nr:hypothetical protein [Desulfobacterales bacterium]
MVTSYRELHSKPTLNVLSKDQIEQIHLATMEVLERTGVQITHLKALELLDGAGASVNGNRVRIPAQMVEEATHTSPSHFALGKRNGEPAIFLEDNKSWFGAGLDCVDYLNPITDDRRRFTSEDCRVTATISNALPNYSWSMTLGLAADVPADIADRANYDAWLKQGAKHFTERLREKTLKTMDLNTEPLPTEIIIEMDRMAKHWN